MRTRIFSKMLNSEVEEYLQRNDIIFVPVGTTESHGGFPLDSETVLGEAVALRMAEVCDGLVLTNLPYFYPGATSVARGTVQMGIRPGIDYLYAIAKSLLHQGFRRQIYLTGHGPAHMTISPVIRDFFDDTGVSILQLDFSWYMATRMAGKGGLDMNTFHYLNLGGYQIMGRLEDVPLTCEFAEPRPAVSSKFNDLSSLGHQGASFGYYFADAREHMPTMALPDAETRKAAADRGEAMINQLVQSMDIPHIVEQLRNVDSYNKEVIEKNPWVPAAWREK